MNFAGMQRFRYGRIWIPQHHPSIWAAAPEELKVVSRFSDNPTNETVHPPVHVVTNVATYPSVRFQLLSSEIHLLAFLNLLEDKMATLADHLPMSPLRGFPIFPSGSVDCVAVPTAIRLSALRA